MIGRIEETSASFEARSAPRSYPTEADLKRNWLIAVIRPPLSSACAAVQRTAPGTVKRDQEKRAHESDVLQKLPLIGHPRRPFHCPERVRKEERKRNKDKQDPRSPAQLKSNQEEQAAKKIDCCNEICDHHGRNNVAREGHEFQDARVSGITGDVRELEKPKIDK